jgi:two-component system, cell cycle sensor histidine kinase and response regulator CckA
LSGAREVSLAQFDDLDIPESDLDYPRLDNLLMDPSFHSRNRSNPSSKAKGISEPTRLELLGRMTSGIVHDLNNMLTVVQGYSSLLMSTLSPNDPNRDMIDEIRQAGERAIALTRQFKAFEKPESTQPIELNLASSLENLRKLMNRIAGEGLQLRFELGCRDAKIRVDPSQFDQFLMMTVLQAREVLPLGGTVIFQPKVSMEESRVCLQVQLSCREVDSTSPLEPLQQQSTLENLIESMQGEMKPRQTDLGWIWEFHFPLYATPDPNAIIHPAFAFPGGGEVVLLVEDDHTVRALARRILRGCGYKLLEAADGDEAISVDRHYDGHIDIVVTDVVMPRLSGREVVQALCSHRPELRVLYMSGYTDELILRHGIRPEACSFLPKPFTPAGLASKVRECLDAIA